MKNEGEVLEVKMKVNADLKIHNKWYKEKNGYWNEFKGIYVKHKCEDLLKESVFKIYDFKYYGIDSIKKDFNYKYWEKISMFITVLFKKHFNGMKCTDWRKVHIEAKVIRMYLGRDYISILEKLEELKIIEISLESNKYNMKKPCKLITLNNAFICVKGTLYTEKNLISEKYQNSIIDYYTKVLNKRKGIEKQIEIVLDKCSFSLGKDQMILDIEIAEDKFNKETKRLSNVFESDIEKKKLLKKLSHKVEFLNEHINQLNKYYNGLMGKLNANELVRKFEYNIQIQEFGNRIGHVFSNMPKKYRKRLKIDGEDVIEVDIVSSQVAFLNILLKKWFDSNSGIMMNSPFPFVMMEKLTMLYSDESRMDLYKYMALKLNGMQGIVNSNTRNEMKLVFMGLLFGSTKYEKYKGRNRKEMISELFGSEFYDLMKEIEKSDVNGITTRKYRNLSALLQREESKFLSEVMNSLMEEGVMFLPLYDSLIVKQSDGLKVNNAFQSIIEKNGFRGIVKVK